MGVSSLRHLCQRRPHLSERPLLSGGDGAGKERRNFLEVCLWHLHTLAEVYRHLAAANAGP